ncbi:MAG TPA: hypothetical protein PLZ08_11530 [Bacillota bacterium]|mgnify:CR=1 FL=1|jgi:hypothetical protein|nr:hypothetical protein [Bacillota bacterium]HOL10843.1 hypothetical protein [Bacillota bacterium]HPO98570.1 hypothetical protein [Bacillota bacterium]
MPNQKQNDANKVKNAPDFKNDQLGENATAEFAEDYDNKSNTINNKTKK